MRGSSADMGVDYLPNLYRKYKEKLE
jgi:hypothetical protein